MVIAAVAGTVIAAGATAYAGSAESSATKDAANTAAGEQRQALTQEEQLAQPYNAQGQAGINTYNALQNPATALQTLQSTPGYQLTAQQGNEAAMRAAASSGLNLSGNQILGVQQQGGLLADSTYQQAISNAVSQEQIGQAAAAGTAANVAGTAGNLSNIAIGQGTNQANITANEVAGITRATSGGANNYATYQTLNNLNNPGGGGGNPQNLGGSTQVGAGGAPLTYDASGNITGVAPPAG